MCVIIGARHTDVVYFTVEGTSLLAELSPFHGIRYNTEKTGSLENVVSPPYDIISPEDRIYYHDLHPNNFVRLVLGEEFEADSQDNNRFTRAGDYLQKWLDEGVFIREERPAIYVYRMDFDISGEKKSVHGLIGAVKLADYDEKVILPHENTLAKPKSGLIELMRNTGANLDSVYTLFSDEEGFLDSIFAKAMQERPTEKATDRDGVMHTLWAIYDDKVQAAITGFMADKQLAIADGHHRYETSLAYRDEVRAVNPDAGVLPSDYIMLTMVNVHQKDMTIYPTHRVADNLDSARLSSLCESLSPLFEIIPSSRETITGDMARENALGLYMPDNICLLKLRKSPEELLSGSKAGRELELNILHKLVLEDQLNIDAKKLREQSNIVYVRDPDEAMSLVDSGKKQAAFLLNHIPVKSVLDIASAGEKMPQKATYFYPKLLSGLVLRSCKNNNQ